MRLKEEKKKNDDEAKNYQDKNADLMLQVGHTTNDTCTVQSIRLCCAIEYLR